MVMYIASRPGRQPYGHRHVARSRLGRARRWTVRPRAPPLLGGHMKGTLPRTALALAVITACLAGSALAQQPRQPQLRHGFWFSGGLGYGSIGCQDRSGRTGSVGGDIAAGGN